MENAPAGADARRAGPPTTPRWPGRVRLGKREWRDVCRGARTLGDIGTLRAAEIHGVKIHFGWAVSHQTPMESSGGVRPTGPKAAGGAAYSQRNEPRQTPAPNSRQRRSAQRLQEFLQLKQAQAQADTSLSASGGSGTPLSGSKREARSRTPEEARKQPRDSPAADDGGVAAARGCARYRHPKAASSWQDRQPGRRWRRSHQTTSRRRRRRNHRRTKGCRTARPRRQRSGAHSRATER